MKTINWVLSLVFFLSMFGWSQNAGAIPAFARKYEKPCSSCHIAWPLLNKAGRTFKEAGYRFPSEGKYSQKISKHLFWGKNFPISAVIKSRPYDKKGNAKDAKTRAINEIEIIAAAAIGKQWSGFVEYEAEDEADFELEFAHAVVTWSYKKWLNVQLANAPSTWADPYDTFSIRGLTRGRQMVIDSAFGGADNGNKLRNNRQSVSIYGRAWNKLFYILGIGATSGDNEGESPKTTTVRLAYEATPKIMVGLLYVNGTCTPNPRVNCLVERDYDRMGIDFQADINRFRVMAATLKAEDDNATATATTENKAYYVQAIYVAKSKGSRKPTWVPILRYDQIEGNDGTTERRAWTANLGYYFKENIKGYVEYYKETKDTINGPKDNRFTIQLELGF